MVQEQVAVHGSWVEAGGALCRLRSEHVFAGERPSTRHVPAKRLTMAGFDIVN